MTELHADYVIVGAGSAGCVLADRLSEDGARVVLLEAGPSDWHPMIHVPAGALRSIAGAVFRLGVVIPVDQRIGPQMRGSVSLERIYVVFGLRRRQAARRI